jgi:hypothetical protein
MLLTMYGPRNGIGAGVDWSTLRQQAAPAWKHPEGTAVGEAEVWEMEALKQSLPL